MLLTHSKHIFLQYTLSHCSCILYILQGILCTSAVGGIIKRVVLLLRKASQQTGESISHKCHYGALHSYLIPTTAKSAIPTQGRVEIF